MLHRLDHRHSSMGILHRLRLFPVVNLLTTPHRLDRHPLTDTLQHQQHNSSLSRLTRNLKSHHLLRQVLDYLHLPTLMFRQAHPRIHTRRHNLHMRLLRLPLLHSRVKDLLLLKDPHKAPGYPLGHPKQPQRLLLKPNILLVTGRISLQAHKEWSTFSAMTCYGLLLKHRLLLLLKSKIHRNVSTSFSIT